MDQNSVAQYYRRGVEAMEKQNWKRAAEMFRLCAKRDPDNVIYPQLLCSCENKRDEDAEPR